MECPHCKYIADWDNEKLETIEGKKGSFFILSNEIGMIRDRHEEDEKLMVRGCPSCNMVFMAYY